MLSSIPLSLPHRPKPLDENDHRSVPVHPEQRKRWTEAVYAVCVLATGVLLLITAF